MKSVLNSFFIAFSMYSRIPMPRRDWREENRRYVLAFFPLVGLVIGALVLLWLLVSHFLWGYALRMVGVIVIPLLVSGGIHFDGFMDVCDACGSWKSREEKLRILKDPHVGSFAVIGAVIYFVTAFGFGLNVNLSFPILFLAFPMSRACASVAVLCLPSSNPSGIAAGFVTEKGWLGSLIINSVYIVTIVFCMLQYSLLVGGFALLGLLGAVLYLLYLTRRVFGGINGDVAGHFVCLAELFMLIGLAVGEAIVLHTRSSFPIEMEYFNIWNWL